VSGDVRRLGLRGPVAGSLTRGSAPVFVSYVWEHNDGARFPVRIQPPPATAVADTSQA
jgi:hypothetical protein